MSKLNPQKATAYVGPGVLRKGGKITPVPDGNLIKKKGIYAGSTLKSGGKVKKAMMGSSIFKDNPIYKKSTEARGMIGKLYGLPGKPIVKNGGPVQKVDPKKYLEESKKRVNKIVTPLRKAEIKKGIITYDDYLNSQIKNKTKAKSGAMIKRADGSMSRRGLWDSIRENKGSGKKPTKQMLVQEKKIKAKSKK